MPTVREKADEIGLAMSFLEPDVEVPVLSAPQAQGDVTIWPIQNFGRTPATDLSVPITSDGVTVLSGQHDHVLTVGDGGEATWAPCTERGTVVLGVLETDSECQLWHTEHGLNLIAPGKYVINRRREQADEVRMIHD